MKPLIERGLLLIIAFAILQFLFSYIFVNSSSRYLPDSTAYDTMVRRFAGENLPNVWEPYRSRVLYTFLVSIPYRLTNNMELSFTLVNIIFQLILAVSCYYIGKEFKFEPLILPLLILSHAQVVKYASLFLTDLAALALASVCILLYYRWIKGEHFTYLLLSLVLLILTRTPFITIVPPIVLFGFLKKKPLLELASLLVVPVAIYFILNAVTGAYSGFDYLKFSSSCTGSNPDPGCIAQMTDRSPVKLFNSFNQAYYPFIFFMPIGFIFSMDWFLVAQILFNLATFPTWTVYYRRFFFPSLVAGGILGVRGLTELSKKFGKRGKIILWLVVLGLIIAGDIFSFLSPEIANQ